MTTVKHYQDVFGLNLILVQHVISADSHCLVARNGDDFAEGTLQLDPNSPAQVMVGEFKYVALSSNCQPVRVTNLQAI